MERANQQLMHREKLAKALVVCFIDRCSNLPVRQTVLYRYSIEVCFSSDRKKHVVNRIHSVE